MNGEFESGKIDQLLAQMTLAENASLTSGSLMCTTKPIGRCGIGSMIRLMAPMECASRSIVEGEGEGIAIFGDFAKSPHRKPVGEKYRSTRRSRSGAAIR